MDKLKHLNIYTQVYKEGNFISAAIKLGLSPSTVSKSISKLESNIGVRLIERSTRSISFTRAGNEYAETAIDIINQLHQQEGNLRHVLREASGSLKLNVPVSYGRLYILPLLPEFKRRYPNINLNITFSDKYVDIIRDGLDLCIRSGQIDDCSLIAKKLSPIDFIYCASPYYIETQSNSLDLNSMSEHTWIKFKFKQSGKVLPVYQPSNISCRSPSHNGFSELSTNNDMVVDDGEAMMELCSNSLGLTQAPHFIARKWLDNGLVKPLLKIYRPKNMGVYAIYPSRNMPERCRVFMTFLQNHLESIGETENSTWTENRGFFG